MLKFCRWRCELRNLPVQFIDLKIAALPAKAFDLITAMDVFEHLVDPVGTVDQLDRALKPGGFLFGRYHADKNDNQADHIVYDFMPTFARLASLGYAKVWQDRWLWGHEVFQKPPDL